MTSTALRAALDIGSNTIRLLVAQISGENLTPLSDVSEFVRLGKGVDATGLLSEDRIRAAIDAIERLAAQASSLGAESMSAVATSAVRDASNRADFVERVHAATGIQVRVLTGDDEARLTYLGVTLGQPVESGIVMCDLGGGSAEVVFASSAGIQWAKSLQFGSGRLTEQYVHHDPPHDEELGRVRSHVRDLLSTLPPATARSTVLTGGTASHIALLLGKSGQQIDLRSQDMKRALKLVELETANSLIEKYSIRPERAEVLPAGVAAAAAIVEYYDTQHASITRRGIREGVIVDSIRPRAS